jgi:hypothetical protein
MKNLFKKIIYTVAFTTVSLSAGTISVDNSWKLAGAPENISISDIQSNSGCVKAIWQYDSNDNNWSLYYRGWDTSHLYNPIENNTLASGSGFWVLGDGECDISYGDNVVLTPTTTATIADLVDSIFYEYEEDHMHWYDEMYFDFTPGSEKRVAVEYDYNGSDWEIDGDYNDSVADTDGSYTELSYPETGWSASFEIIATEKINSVDDIDFDDLYVSDVNITILNPGTGETHLWDDYANPQYYDQVAQTLVYIEDSESLRDAYIVGGWTYDDNFLDENTSEVQEGTVRKAVWDGYSYIVGCTQGDCRELTKGEVVGSWEFDLSGLEITLSKGVSILTVVQENSDYFIQEHERDILGASNTIQIMHGDDASETTIRSWLTR